MSAVDVMPFLELVTLNFEAERALILKQSKGVDYLSVPLVVQCLGCVHRQLQPHLSVYLSTNLLLLNKSENFLLSAFFI